MSAREREEGGRGDGGSAADELRELYRRLAPPPVPDELERADAETQRVVTWMRGAWRALEVPVRAAPRRSRAGRTRRLAFAAAAAVLVAGAALLLRALAPGPRPGRVAPEDASASAVEVLDVGSDRVELRSGPVRLVLLGPPPPRPSEPHSGS